MFLEEKAEGEPQHDWSKWVLSQTSPVLVQCREWETQVPPPYSYVVLPR